MKVRPLWVLVHRYAGLAMTVFLAVVGLTGSLLAFYAELERVVSPQLYVEANGRKPLDLMGLLIVMLSATGVVIRLKKRRSRT